MSCSISFLISKEGEDQEFLPRRGKLGRLIRGNGGQI